MRKIILCADDYAQNEAVSKGIVTLLAKQRLSATSCLTTSAEWIEHAGWLKPYENQIDIGLHFNLTEGPQKKFCSITTALLKSHLRMINKKMIEKELEQQLDFFVTQMNRLPDFIDGHLHVQHFPVIRDALLAVYQRHFTKKNCYIRVANHGWLKGWKSFIVTASGARVLKKQLNKLAIPHNDSFAGFYNFADAKNYSEYFKNFLKAIDQKGLIMCHPGLPSTAKDDCLYKSRGLEYRYFMSDEFINDCQREQIAMVRYQQC